MSCFLGDKELWFYYIKKKYVLSGINLCIKKNELISIVGDNGSGKTTLLLVLAGLLEPKKGAVFFEGRDIRSLNDYRRRIAILFQDPEDQIFNMTVRDELRFTLNQLGIRDEELLFSHAKRFSIDEFLDKSPFELSYGEKKMVVLASITIHDPEILILDEPFAGLGLRYRQIVLDYIVDAKKSGKTIIIATHNPSNVIGLTERFVVLDKGKIIFDGTHEQLLLSDVLRKANIIDPCYEYLHTRKYCEKYS